MHPSSMKNMSYVRKKFLTSLQNKSIIVDVGGRGNQSYKDLFVDIDPQYCIVDILDGKGVTHLMPSPYHIPFDDNYADIVVSGQMLEHCSNPFKIMAEMRRITKVNGFIVIIAPSAGPNHGSQDCWRFMKSAFKCIVEDIGGIKIVADWIQKDAPDGRSREWQDHVFVGQKELHL